MDQLRTALAWLKRHHFWVLCVFAALVAIGCWWKASGKMQSLYKTHQTQITTEFKNVKSLRDDPFHPNQDVNDKQAAETKTQAQGVAKIWQQLYDRQREEVLKWPVPPLSKEFGDYVEKLQFGADIPPMLRNNYQNYVEGHFKELPKAIDARPISASAATGPGGGRGYGFEGAAGLPDELQDESDYVCQWLDQDQAHIRDELHFTVRPSSLRIWVTQEDLWVYHTLLRVIAKTNQAAHASRMSNAAVKVVAELAVGQRAATSSRTPNRLTVPPPAVVATEATGPGVSAPAAAAPGRPGYSGPDGGGAPGQAMTEEQDRAMLLSWRYLDGQGKPLPFGAGAAPAGEDVPPAEASAGAGQPLDLTIFGQEYKRLPVRMVLRMDLRWLPRLISECASEPLQIEVQEVRVNVPEAAGGGGGPGGGFRFEGGPGGGSAAANSFPEETEPQPFPSHPEIVNVIIQGTIYIFNKPNPSILQPTEQHLANNGG